MLELFVSQVNSFRREIGWLRIVLEFYIDTWNYGSEARFMNHNCRGNVEIVLQDSGYLYVIASHNIHPNTFLESNYFGVGENNVCECTDLPFQVSCTFEAAPP